MIGDGLTFISLLRIGTIGAAAAELVAIGGDGAVPQSKAVAISDNVV
jgi:hypothetical protein